MLLRSSTSQHYTAVSKLSKFLYSAYTSYIFNNVPNITFLLLNKLLISIYRPDAKKKNLFSLINFITFLAYNHFSHLKVLILEKEHCSYTPKNTCSLQEKVERVKCLRYSWSCKKRIASLCSIQDRMLGAGVRR